MTTPIFRWTCIVGSVAALAAAPSLVAADEFAADYTPTSQEVARLCVAHGRYCECAGCRAYYKACDIPCPPGALTPDMLPDTLPEGAPEAPSLEDALETGEPEPMSGPLPAMSSDLSAMVAGTSASPGMIGDFFGGGYQYLVASPVNGAAVAVAGGDRILKFADNNSPLPQDRLFFNYHLFDDPVQDVNGRFQDVNRFTFGLEKTAWDGRASIEFRVPFEASVSSEQTVGAANTTSGEFGNLALAFKLLLFERGPWAVAGGLGMIFPTADDSTIFLSPSQPLSTFANESYFLQPFLGVYWRPTSSFFTQFVTQVNFDVSGSTVTLFDTTFGASGSDRIFEQSLLFLDYSAGYWIYRTKRCDKWITGIAPMVELHYTSTLNDLDLPDIDGANVFEADFRRDALNITGGVLFAIGPQTSLRIAGVAPLRDENLMFDAEFGVQLIRNY